MYETTVFKANRQASFSPLFTKNNITISIPQRSRYVGFHILTKLSNNRGKAAIYKGFPVQTRHLMAYSGTFLVLKINTNQNKAQEWGAPVSVWSQLRANKTDIEKNPTKWNDTKWRLLLCDRWPWTCSLLPFCRGKCAIHSNVNLCTSRSLVSLVFYPHPTRRRGFSPSSTPNLDIQLDNYKWRNLEFKLHRLRHLIKAVHGIVSLIQVQSTDWHHYLLIFLALSSLH